MKTLEQLVREEAAYQPSQQVRAILQHVQLVCVVGGTAVGKNFLMQASGLPVVGTMTSRAPRPSDDPKVYRYVSNEELIQMIERGELVQYAVDLSNQVIYGSMPSDYIVSGPNIADIWHWSVDMLKDKGFGSVRTVSVITPWEQWQAHLHERFTGRDKVYQTARLEEAKKSLAWTRSRLNDPDHLLIINDPMQTENSVNQLREFAHGKNLVSPPEAAPLIDNLLGHLSQEV